MSYNHALPNRLVLYVLQWLYKRCYCLVVEEFPVRNVYKEEFGWESQDLMVRKGQNVVVLYEWVPYLKAHAKEDLILFNCDVLLFCSETYVYMKAILYIWGFIQNSMLWEFLFLHPFLSLKKRLTDLYTGNIITMHGDYIPSVMHGNAW